MPIAKSRYLQDLHTRTVGSIARTDKMLTERTIKHIGHPTGDAAQVWARAASETALRWLAESELLHQAGRAVEAEDRAILARDAAEEAARVIGRVDYRPLNPPVALPEGDDLAVVYSRVALAVRAAGNAR